MTPDLRTQAPAPERRSGFRYPVSLELSYRSHQGRFEIEGQGKTLDFSSSGILFVAEHVLTAGAAVELTLQWPFLLDDLVPLQLRVSAKVMRSEGTLAAVGIVSHEFRTAVRKGVVRPNIISSHANNGNGRRALPPDPRTRRGRW